MLGGVYSSQRCRLRALRWYSLHAGAGALIPSLASLDFQNLRFLAIVNKIIVVLLACGVPNDPSVFNGSSILHASVHVKSICAA